MSELRCPKCGAKVYSTDTTCLQCGGPLVTRPTGPGGRPAERAPARRREPTGFAADLAKSGASVGAAIGTGIGLANAVVARLGGGDGFLGPLTRSLSLIGVTLVLLVVGVIVGGLVGGCLVPRLSAGGR